MKAIVMNGSIQPQEPLPADWSEGTELEIEKIFTPLTGDALDQWYADMEAIASEGDPEDDERLRRAIQENHDREKEAARIQLGLSAEVAYTDEDLDRWMATVQASAEETDPDDEVILEKSIRGIRDQARDFARKEAEAS
jgi:hypothetical protein